MKDLAGKRALVTGGSRGIGAATAEMFAEYGVHVAIGYRSRKEDADQMVKRLKDRGVTAAAFSTDISTREGADKLVQQSVQSLGGLDYFVGNAGIWPADDVPVADMDDHRWRRTMAENVDSMFFTTRAAARAMNDQGRIVLVASTAGQRGEAMHADYAASKGAMISYVKSMCIELAPRGITVNSVAPGWVDTEMCEKPFAGTGKDAIARNIPVGRIAAPRDIAGPIVFLCSDLARHITGEIVNVNGGSVLAG
jgi:3-oxoacyl-[acyl-carrier protein] reductase